LSASTGAESAPSADGFWEFSLRIYGQPAVPPACLALQDEGGADVNVVLFLLYLADCGRRLDAGSIAALDAAVRPWRETVVRALREVRRQLRSDIGAFAASTTRALRDRVKGAELAAEKLQQHALATLYPPHSCGLAASSSGEAAADHLACYAALCPAPWPEDALHTLIDAWANDARARGVLT
jgi:uncharacterized protein (TIGR02444 family)